MHSFKVGFMAETLVDNGETIAVRGLRIKASERGRGIGRCLWVNTLERNDDKNIAFTTDYPATYGLGANGVDKHIYTMVSKFIFKRKIYCAMEPFCGLISQSCLMTA